MSPGTRTVPSNEDVRSSRTTKETSSLAPPPFEYLPAPPTVYGGREVRDDGRSLGPRCETKVRASDKCLSDTLGEVLSNLGVK